MPSALFFVSRCCRVSKRVNVNSLGEAGRTQTADLQGICLETLSLSYCLILPPLFCGVAAVIVSFSYFYRCSSSRSHSPRPIFSLIGSTNSLSPSEVGLHRQHISPHTCVVLPWGWDTAYCPTVQGLPSFYVLPVIGLVNFILTPDRVVICLPGFPDLVQFFPMGQIFRFLAMVRAGRIPVWASPAGIGPIIFKSFCHTVHL